MPSHLAETAGPMRDMLYLAAYEAAFSALPLPKLVEMLTTHVGLKQALVHRVNGWPVSFILWARMNDASVRRLMTGGYAALDPADLHSGERLVLVGVCSPWRREDFDQALGWSAVNLSKLSADGQWYMILPPADGIPPRLTRYVRVDETHGRFEEARL